MEGSDVRVFDRFARVYDLLMPGADRTALERGLAAATRPVERLVDVGGGPGRAASALDARTRVVVDAADGMCRQARANGLEAVRGDGARLPLQTASVDAVVVTDALHHMGDHWGVVTEATRVLRPGGVFVVSEFYPTTLRGRALVAAERVVGFDSSFHSPDDLAGMMKGAGLAASVLEPGFGYTVVGRRETNERPKSGETVE
jgi:demethylmenaquinone methyltransferase/2-methoxy-6-polyprenyl-1,4-benzoquinol methylase